MPEPRRQAPVRPRARASVAADLADSDGPFEPDAVGVDQGFVFFDLGGKDVEEPLQFTDEIRGDILTYSTDPG